MKGEIFYVEQERNKRKCPCFIKSKLWDNIACPLLVGVDKMLLNCRYNTASIGDIAFAFKNSYGNVVLISFLKNFFIFLWSLLFIFPGIINSNFPPQIRA